MSDQDLPYFARREHAYAELVSSIDWTERFIEEGVRENDEGWLKSGVKDFLVSERGLSEEEAGRKVSGLLNEGGVEAKKVVNAAEGEGFLEHFRLNEPWHPKAFYSEDFVSYPFQHTSVVVYRGMRRRFFYKSNVQDEEERSRKHPTSIFNHQYLRPGSSLEEGDEQDYIWTTPSLKEAKEYGGGNPDGVVLEIQIPVKWLVFGAKRKEEVSSLREMHEKFGSPENFHSYLTGNWDSSETTFKISREMPIHYVRGAWDLESYDEPEFLPFYSDDERDLLDAMREVDGDKIPERPSISRNWKDSDEIVKQRKRVERALQHDFKLDSRDLDELLGIVKDGQSFTYSNYIDFFRSLEGTGDELRDTLRDLKQDGGHRKKRRLQKIFFSINKVMENVKRDFGQDYQVSEVSDEEQLLKLISRREEILDEYGQQLEEFSSKLSERREELRDIYNEELVRKDDTPANIDLEMDTRPLEEVLNELHPFKLSEDFSVSADFPSINWLKEKINLVEREEQELDKDIHVEDETIRDMKAKYDRDEVVDPDKLRDAAERLKDESFELKEVGKNILKIEEGEIDAKEAFEGIEDRDVKEKFNEEVQETEELVKRFNQELARIKKEAAILSSISSVQSTSAGALTRTSVMVEDISENLSEIHREDQRINDLVRKI